jgi:hypothetical protein
LLGIDEETSEEYRVCVTDGYSGVKPGWCRVSMHYVMDDLEVDFLLDAVEFVARCGGEFLPLYDFDLFDGSWHKKDDATVLQCFSLESALKARGVDETPMPFDERKARYTSYLEEALELAFELQKQGPSRPHHLEGALGELQFFSLPECCIKAETRLKNRGLMSKIKSVFGE